MFSCIADADPRLLEVGIRGRMFVPAIAGRPSVGSERRLGGWGVLAEWTCHLRRSCLSHVLDFDK